MRVRRLTGAEPLVLGNTARFAEAFFRMDPSAVRPNCYDDRVLHTPPNRIVSDDIHAINTTMAARSKPDWWSAVLSEGADSPWLAALRGDWSLFEVPDLDWLATVRPALVDTLSHVVGPYRGLSVATKVLHLKRPELIPVCDDLVRQVLGGRLSAAPGSQAYLDQAVAIIEHVREEGRANIDSLRAIRRWLVDRGIRPRSLVRIFDALLWSSHPDTWMYPLWKVLAD